MHVADAVGATRCSRTTSTSSPGGADSSSTRTQSRSRVHARGRISAAINRLAIGSARVKPVVAITSPATIAAAEPKVSPSDSR